MLHDEFCETYDGSCPVLDVLESLDEECKVKVSSIIKILQDYGNSLREAYSKSFGNDILS